MWEHLDFPDVPSSTVCWRAFYLEPVAGSGERITVGVGLQAEGGPVVFRPALDSRSLNVLFGRQAAQVMGLVDLIRAEVEARDSLEEFAPPFSGAHAGKMHKVFAESVEQVEASALEMSSAFVWLGR